MSAWDQTEVKYVIEVVKVEVHVKLMRSGGKIVCVCLCALEAGEESGRYI